MIGPRPPSRWFDQKSVFTIAYEMLRAEGPPRRRGLAERRRSGRAGFGRFALLQKGFD